MAIAAITNQAQLQAWFPDQVVEAHRAAEGPCCFLVKASRPEWADIEFVFNPDITVLLQLGFGPWHGHFGQSFDERRNLRCAIATARTLVTGSRCLFVQRMTGGKYLGSGIDKRDARRLNLSKGFGYLERIAFDQPPANVPIDLHDYHQTRDGSYIEKGWRNRLKRDYAGLGIDVSMFD